MEHLCLIAQSSPLLATLAAVGAVFLGYKALGFLKTLLDVYVLGGISVTNLASLLSWTLYWLVVVSFSSKSLVLVKEHGQVWYIYLESLKDTKPWLLVITGASDGIGKEFAEQLAKKKFNVLLVSRTASKLEAIAKDIGKGKRNMDTVQYHWHACVADKYGVETKTYAMDFTKGDQNDFAQLGQMMNDIRVGVLVNNVGTNHDIPTPFDEESDKVVDDIIEVNVKGTLRMTKLVLPQMRSKYVYGKKEIDR